MAEKAWEVIPGGQPIVLPTAGTYVDRNIIIDAMPKVLFEGEPALTVTFTTGANTSYYDALHFKASEVLTYPIEPIALKIECDTLRSGIHYKYLAYATINNYNNMNLTNAQFTWVENANTSYCPSYMRAYYTSSAADDIKWCIRNNSADITSATYTISLHRYPKNIITPSEGTKAVVVTTNYSNGTEQYLAGNGLQETGDNNTVDQISSTYYRTNGTGIKLSRYGLFGYDRQGNTQGISIYETSSAGQTTAHTSRVFNTLGIDYTRGLWYASTSSTLATSNSSSYAAYKTICCDYRYSDNEVSAASGSTTLTFANNKPIYLRGVIKSDGLFYLAPMTVTYNSASYKKVWTQTIPTAVEKDTDGNPYVYWYVGYPYPDTNIYRVKLDPINELYWFNNGRFEKYSAISNDIDWIDF